MLKRTLALLLLVVLLITACGSNETPAVNEGAAAGDSGEEAAVQPADAEVIVFRAPT